MRSPLKSIGAWSFSPSPITTTPSIEMLSSTTRMALTAAPSAPFLSPRPIHRPAAMAAASVTRTSSMARLRSGACGVGLTAATIVRPGVISGSNVLRADLAPTGWHGLSARRQAPPGGVALP